MAASRLILAFISPNYFASEWCRREWRMWIDVEISKHVLSAGAAPLYIVEVPGLHTNLDEQQVARDVAQLCNVAAWAGPSWRSRMPMPLLEPIPAGGF